MSKLRAGVIPYYRDDGVIMVRTMIPSDRHFGGIMPQVAKGLVDEGESFLDAAFREAQEEIGLRRENIKDDTFELLGTFMRIRCYICEVHYAEDQFWDEPHYETGWAGWLPLVDINKFRDIQRPIFISMYKHLTENII